MTYDACAESVELFEFRLLEPVSRLSRRRRQRRGVAVRGRGDIARLARSSYAQFATDLADAITGLAR